MDNNHTPTLDASTIATLADDILHRTAADAGVDVPQPLSEAEQDALAAAVLTDAGAPFEPATLARLRATLVADLAGYQRLRGRLKATRNVNMAALDQALATPSTGSGQAGPPGQGQSVLFPTVEPWPEPVDGAALLDSLIETFGRYVIMTAAQRQACTLWTVFTHVFALFRHSPRLLLKSATKRCGKTRLVEILELVVARALCGDNITASAVFRVVDKHGPTLLLDEADRYIKSSEDGGEALCCIINSSHRRGGGVIRTVGDDHEPKRFSTFCPMVISGIGAFSDTIEDRSVIITLQRRLDTEPVAELDDDCCERLDTLKRQIVRWADDNRDRLAAAKPALPKALNDRAKDNWRPLVAIADAAGGDWPRLAREAARELSGAAPADMDNTSAGLMLLYDIRRLLYGVYDGELERCHIDAELGPKTYQNDCGERPRGFEKLSSEGLALALAELPDRPWRTWSHGRPISPHRIASLLKEFGICPRSIRTADGKRPNGYLRLQFEDAFRRYLEDDASVTALASTEANVGGERSGGEDMSNTSRTPPKEVPTIRQHNDINDLQAKQSSDAPPLVGTLKRAQPLEFTSLSECRNSERGDLGGIGDTPPIGGPDDGLAASDTLLQRQVGNTPLQKQADGGTGENTRAGCNGASVYERLRSGRPSGIADLLAAESLSWR